MIRYALACDRGHAFESWFRGSDDFDSQAGRGLVACPVCGSAKVEKQIMAPSVARTDAPRDVPEAPAAENREVALIGEQENTLRAMIRAVREQLLADSEHVGARFAEEARRIHYGESEQRTIHGEASPEDARALHEEGIVFHPLPGLPDERN